MPHPPEKPRKKDGWLTTMGVRGCWVQGGRPGGTGRKWVSRGVAKMIFCCAELMVMFHGNFRGSLGSLLL